MAVGIIAEYNPFHNGHAYQISEVRKILPNAEIVAVMSGSFTQRGEPAILDKWTRARLAVSNGVDLVLELPFVYAVRSAQDFARGGVNLLAQLGIIDTLAFGAEVSDLEKLKLAASVFNDKNFAEKLKSEMAGGTPYAAAVTKILSGVAQVDIGKPNTILAIEYLRALPKNITPLLIPRGKIISSATAIRHEIYKNPVQWEKISVPANVLQKLKAAEFPNEEFLFRPLLVKILTSKLDDLKKICDMNEGIEFKLIESARSAKTFSEFVGGVVNKRFPISRVKRLLLHFLLNVTFFEVGNYARILAFNERGQKLIKQIQIPTVTKVAKHLTSKEILAGKVIEPYKKNLALDLQATDLRETLFSLPKNLRQDFIISPLKN